ncbi:MAG: NUDIX hydrolase [Cytophagales bacterium]
MHSPEHSEIIKKHFGDRLRVRVCGLLVINHKVLLVGHKGISNHDFFWSPPGGGVEFGESLEQALIREFQEETGLYISVKHFLGFYEYLHKPLHAIEFFFEVNQLNGFEKVGTDPELHENNQIIDKLSWFNDQNIKENKNGLWFHPMLKHIDLKISPLKPFISTNSRDL